MKLIILVQKITIEQNLSICLIWNNKKSLNKYCLHLYFEEFYNFIKK